MAAVSPSAGPIPILALDVGSVEGAQRMLRQVKGLCTFAKVGSELFTAAGPEVVRAVRAAGCDVFLDLKLHDIPNTVRAATRAARELGVRLLTVHAAGGRAVVEAAVSGAGPECGVFAVTVLTSMDGAAVAEATGRERVEVLDEVLRLAALARAGGARGVVCSGREASAVREQHGPALQRLVPGIRFADGAAHDQARVVTPGAAAASGADYLVIGRAVTAAADPAAAMRRVLAELRLSAGAAPA
jgi:orotidine-5'-phosphate decarboxylase